MNYLRWCTASKRSLHTRLELVKDLWLITIDGALLENISDVYRRALQRFSPTTVAAKDLRIGQLEEERRVLKEENDILKAPPYQRIEKLGFWKILRYRTMLSKEAFDKMVELLGDKVLPLIIILFSSAYSL